MLRAINGLKGNDMENRPRRASPGVTRSRLVLEVASELVGDPAWSSKQVRVAMRPQGAANPWSPWLYASDAPDGIAEVARGETQLAIVNPAEPLAMAIRGKGPFTEPIPLRIITVIPSRDQFAFVVAERTGIRSLAELRDRRYPLRVMMRDQTEHSNYLAVHTVLSALGFSLGDIVSWGGSITRHPLPPDVGAVERGEVDAFFEEGVGSWLDRAVDAGMRALSLDEPLLTELEGLGLRRATFTRATHPSLQGVQTLDFSGWPVFTHADTPDAVVEAFCRALVARADRIPWQGDGPLPIHRMCLDAPDTPLTAPLHPAAERFWRACGYLG